MINANYMIWNTFVTHTFVTHTHFVTHTLVIRADMDFSLTLGQHHQQQLHSMGRSSQQLLQSSQMIGRLRLWQL